MTHHTIAVVSGGLDSVTLAYWLHDRGHRLHLLSVDYGQRHRREIEFAAEHAARLGAEHSVADLRPIAGLLGGSALTSAEIEVPDGHYAEETMRATVVPNRNSIILNIAAGLAVRDQAMFVATGVHAGDHFIYPDCRPEFIAAVERQIIVANDGFLPATFALLAPFVNMSKAEIVAAGARLNVPFARTWSCYRGGEIHCGSCGTCFERREAFDHAGIADPTIYASTPLWLAPPLEEPGGAA